MRLISGPAIAALHRRTRKWAHAHLHRGTFGPFIELDGILYAEVPNVERAAGETFDEARLALAADGKPGRLLTLPDHEEAA